MSAFSINSFFNLTKMAHLDSNSKSTEDIDPNRKSPSTPTKNCPSLSDLKSDFNSKNLNESTNLKMESDEESQRDSSSLDEEMLMADGKKVRVRSVLSEETLRILRAQYAINQRPKKQEIHRLAEQVNYAPRVVQVWFQNMRYVKFCLTFVVIALTFDLCTFFLNSSFYFIHNDFVMITFANAH